MIRNKLIYVFGLFLLSFIANAQIVEFADTNFLNVLRNPTSVNNKNAKIDKDGDGLISYEEAANVNQLEIYTGKSIKSTKGIDAFINLKKLVLRAGTGEIFDADTINVNGLGSLQNLSILGAREVKLGTLQNLTVLRISDGLLTSIDLKGCDSLETLTIGNSTTSIGGRFEEIDLRNMQFLKSVTLSHNDSLKSIKINDVNLINAFSVSFCNNLESLSLEFLTEMTKLTLKSTMINMLDFSTNIKLTEIEVENIAVQTADITMLSNLQTLTFSHCPNIENINITGLSDLEMVYVEHSSKLAKIIGLETIEYIRGLKYNNTLVDYTDITGNLDSLVLLETNGCIPYISPNNTSLLYIVTPYQGYCLANDVDVDLGGNSQDPITGALDTYDFEVCTELNNIYDCKLYPTISGKIFIDENKNNAYDDDENGFNNVEVNVEPGSYTVFSDQNGDYKIALKDIGNYNFSVVNPTYYESNLPTETITITSPVEEVEQSIALTTNEEIKELVVRVDLLNRPRPGFDMNFLVTAYNTGTNTIGSTVLKFKIPESFEINSSEFYTIIDDTVMIDIATTKPGDYLTTVIEGSIVADPTLIGMFDSTFVHTVFNDDADVIIDSDQSIVKYEITGSYDPNDKATSTTISKDEVEKGTFLDYTIRFQNTGNDTAFTVIIVDTLSSQLDLESFEIVSNSHTMNTSIEGNVVVFKFSNILLVDSTTNEPLSHGYINYQIKPLTNLNVNDVINNTAYIYFDYNPPIITNTTQTVVIDDIILSSVMGSLNDQTSKIYPNVINLGNIIRIDRDDIESVKVYTTNGGLIKTINVKNKTFDTTGINSGSYIIRMISNDKHTFFDKFQVK